MGILDFLPPPPVDKSLQGQFAKFHGDNPAVYHRLVELANELYEAGHRNYSIAGLFEVLRWETAIRTRSMDGFKISNNHRAYYARFIMERNPHLRGFFRTRPTESDS